MIGPYGGRLRRWTPSHSPLPSAIMARQFRQALPRSYATMDRALAPAGSLYHRKARRAAKPPNSPRPQVATQAAASLSGIDRPSH